MIDNFLNQIPMALLFVVPLLFSVIIHEVSHGWVAGKLGDPTAKIRGRITLNPISHIDPIGSILVPLILIISKSHFLIGWAKPVPVDPRYFKNPRKGMLWVGLAGPVSNLLLALIFALLLKFLSPFLQSKLLSPLNIMMYQAIIINVCLAVFNLIPIPPLDGGRVIVGLLPIDLARKWAAIEPYGFIIIIILLFTNLISYIIYPVIKLFFTLIAAMTGIPFNI